MKVLLLNGSPRKNGNTAQLLKRAMDAAREAGGKGQEITITFFIFYTSIFSITFAGTPPTTGLPDAVAV